MLTLSNITKTYKNKHRYVNALNNINLTFANKGLVFILGESGAGKSTLLNLISLQERQSKGNIYIEGIDTNKLSNKKLSTLRSSYFGIIFQDLNLISDFNVYQNIAIAKQIRHEDVNKEDILNLFDKLNLDKNILNEKVDNLSGGQKQRIAIIRALIKDPKILICDEPTGSLDSNNALAIFDILKEIAKDRLVIVVSHNEILANKYASRIIKLELGHIISDTDDNNNDITIKEDNNTNNTNYDINNLKPTHLPLKVSLSLGLKSFKKSVVRLIFAMFTTFISIGMFMGGATFYSYNEETALRNEYLAQGYRYVAFNKPNNQTYTKDIIENAKDIFDDSVAYCQSSRIYFSDPIQGLRAVDIYTFPNLESFYDLNFNYIGDIPKHDNEAMVSSYVLFLLNLININDLSNGDVLSNFLNYTFNDGVLDITISGIYISNSNDTFYYSFLVNEDTYDTRISENDIIINSSSYAHNLLIDITISDLATKTLNFFNKSFPDSNNYISLTDTYNPHLDNVSKLNSFVNQVGTYMIIISSVLLAASLIGLGSYIVFIIKKKVNTIRILKSIGMSNLDIQMIYSFNTFLITFLIYTLALISYVVILFCINDFIYTTMEINFLTSPLNYSFLITGLVFICINLVTFVLANSYLSYLINKRILRK